jgi:hypothetical protein
MCIQNIVIGEQELSNFSFFFFDVSTQEKGEGFELITSASLGVVPVN